MGACELKRARGNAEEMRLQNRRGVAPSDLGSDVGGWTFVEGANASTFTSLPSGRTFALRGKLLQTAASTQASVTGACELKRARGILKEMRRRCAFKIVAA